jgi:predicted outer membrane repeat protein
VWESEGNLSIDGLTITGGFDIGDRPAGAIHMDGQELTITNSSIVNNQTCGDGGGIYMHTGEGRVHVENSTIAGNSAAGSGGAIASNGDSDTQIEVVNSTITGNSAGWGGAIDLQSGEQLSLTYVTLAGNTTDAEGISCQSEGGSVSDVHGAVAPTAHAQANGSAANIQFDDTGSTLTTFGSVIALPVAGPNCSVEAEEVIKSLDALGNTDSGGYNYSDDTSCDLTGTGDRQGAPDPQLTALGPNGGPTETRPPTETSPLVDGVPLPACHPDGIAVDQRGITRPQRGGCDIGAVELVFTEPTPAPEALPLVVTPHFTG